MNTFANTFMNASVIEKIPVASLYPDRYGIGKTKVYEYLKTLGIKSFRDGKDAFITFEQLGLLDEYCKRLTQGKEAAEAFVAQVSGSMNESREHVHELVHTQPLTESPTWMLLVEAIVERLSPPTPDPLATQQQLQRICDLEWIVSSSQLSQILGVSRSGLKEGDRYGFRLTKVGRVGREAAWRVEKAAIEPS